MKKSIYELVSLFFPAQVTSVYFFVLLLANSLVSHIPELVIAILFSSLIPLASVLIYVKMKKLDLFVSDRNERHLLFYIAVLSNFIGFLILSWMHATFIVSALMLSYTINTIAAALINRVDKISIHVWGISGPAVSLFYQYGYPAFTAAILISLLVGVSRVKVKAHTPWQVISAVLISVPLTASVIYYLAPLLIRL